MPICPRCGANNATDAEICSVCSATLFDAFAKETTKKRKKTAKKVKDFTAEMDPQDIEDTKVFALLSYLGGLFLVPLLACKESKYARFHTNQGIVLFLSLFAWNLIGLILCLILSFLGGIVSGIATALLGSLGVNFVFSLVSSILPLLFSLVPFALLWAGNIVLLVFCIMGIVNALRGHAKTLPLIGHYKILK